MVTPSTEDPLNQQSIISLAHAHCLRNSQTSNCITYPSTWTDHHLLTIEFLPERTDIGPGCWRLNPTFLTMPAFQQLLKQLIETFFANPHIADNNDAGYVWETLKSVLQAAAKSFGRQFQPTARRNYTNLQKE
ncbi:hypothetical protein EC973_007332, partial [Apophysomyces ossiformis]